VGEDVPDNWCEKIKSAAETGTSSDVEIDHNGRKFQCTLTPVENEDYVNIYGRDITERRRAEDLLRVRLELMEFSSSHSVAELLQKTLDLTGELTGSPIGFYHFVDRDQKNLSLQAWSTRTLEEYCKAEGKGMHYSIEEAGVWVDCVREKKAVIHNDYATLLHRKGLPQGHAELVRELVVPILNSGNVVAILGVGNKPANYDDKDTEVVTYFAEIAWEIAERKRSEEILKSYAEKLETEVNERTRELREAQEKLVRQEKLAMLGQLSGSVSHELRNPLGVISNAVYYLNMIRPEMDEKMRRYLEIIDKETHTADKIITDLLDYSRIKSLDREPAVVSDLVGDVLKRFPTPQGVDLVLKIPKNLPKVHTDPTHLGQVLGNLIMNAYQAMPTASLPEGPGCTLTITARQVDSSGFTTGDGRTYVAIAVKDSGVGIAPEHLSKIFEPLFTTKARGIGLGLAICKSLVEANGGQIEVQSELGQGSTFTIYVPIYKETR
jgi:signal transduction histidine kinase